MRLIRFRAEGVHGFIKFDIKFNKDLSLLTGINGSGKTTALRSIVSLITPDLVALSELEYKRISVEIDDRDKPLEITATSTEDFVVLSTSLDSQPLSFPRVQAEFESNSRRTTDQIRDFYREFLATNANHPVIKRLSVLPNPMFLGLDRRTHFDEDIRRIPRSSVFLKPDRKVFSGSLAASLVDAAALAIEKFRDALINSGRIADELQREMLLELLGEKTEAFDDPFALPTRQDIAAIKNLRGALDVLPQIIRLDPNEVNIRILPLLDALEATASLIPPDTDVQKLMGDPKDYDGMLSHIFRWNESLKHFRRIKIIQTIVARYNKLRDQNVAGITRYKDLVNGFLSDSGKNIDFNERGYLHVVIDGVPGERDITSLSSGEAQIFVILTQLSFNPLAQKNNVFIIDEPELSLHVQWQELFIDSVLAANPNIQYIMATHSPSIVLDKVSQCIDISRPLVRKTAP